MDSNDVIAESYLRQQELDGDPYGEKFNGGVELIPTTSISSPIAENGEWGTPQATGDNMTPHLAQMGGTLSPPGSMNGPENYQSGESQRELQSLRQQLDEMRRKGDEANLIDLWANSSGATVGTLTAAAGAAVGSPLLMGIAPIAGVWTGYQAKKEMSDPPVPERDITGMNGQDFEGIRNK